MQNQRIGKKNNAKGLFLKVRQKTISGVAFVTTEVFDDGDKFSGSMREN